jgi:hypothetical protein
LAPSVISFDIFYLCKEQLFNALFFSFFRAITFPHAAVDNKNVSRMKKTTENKMQKTEPLLARF